MLEIFFKGGPVMYPLLLCSIVTLAVAIERQIYFLRRTADADELMEDVRFAVEQGRVIEAVQIAKNSRSPVAALIISALTNIGKSREEIQEVIRLTGENEIRKLERNMALLDLTVAVAPLLGLLGTVTGIIRSFNILAATAGLTEPAALSGGIAEALITTAAGLIIAIPAQVLYTYFSGLIERHISTMNNKSVDIVALATMSRSDAA